jgi:hypothetical protein
MAATAFRSLIGGSPRTAPKACAGIERQLAARTRKIKP